MGLDLLPRPRGPQPKDIAAGKTHRDSEPCPFESDKNPIGVFATCCSFRGSPTALYLVAMGLGQLAIDLYASKGPIEAGEFAKALRAAAAQMRKGIDEARQRADIPAEKPLDKYEIQVPDVGWQFPLSEALLALEACATWHEKVALMGFGVHAWF